MENINEINENMNKDIGEVRTETSNLWKAINKL